jgi:hypothetical protein
MDAREAGDKIETLLAELRTRAGPQAAQTAEDLVSCLVQLYGAGLEAIMSVAAEDQRLQAKLIADPLVESLLLIHDLHPMDTVARVRRALRRLGPGAELQRLDADGLVHVKLSGCGVPVASVEQAIADAAPETTGVRVAAPEPPLLQITPHPAAAK